jgi:phosphatidylglycerol---prolipoprotein diacylglyceryl transferase
MDWTYSAIMLAAVVTGFVLFRLQPRPPGVRPWQMASIALGAFCGGVIGAKLPFVLADWDGFMSGTAWFADGKTILAGLVGGYFGAEATEWALDIRAKMCDVFAVPLAAGIGIGRLACFHAGCCAGVGTSLPWGVDFGDGLVRHPTQLYESAFHLSAAVVLWQLQRRGLFRGQLVRLYLVAYFVYRFATEFVRPEPTIWLGLTGYQLATLVLTPFFALWCCPGYRPWWLRRRIRPRHLPNDRGDGPLKTTRTLCPECLQPVPGTTFQRDGRIYLRHECPRHGTIEALVSSSRRHYYLRDEVPHAPLAPIVPPTEAKEQKVEGGLPVLSAAGNGGDSPSDKACGCGSGPEHRTCVALLEITGACNLHCPVCFAQTSKGGHRPMEEVLADLEAFLASRGPLDILQLSGGEPLLHPDLLAIIDRCQRLPIEQVVINTNGLELLRNDGLAAQLAARHPGLQLFLQFDGLDVESHAVLRGADLLARKRAILDLIVRHNLPSNLACTVVKGVNESQLGALFSLAVKTPQIGGITYQPATWCGRFQRENDPMDRVTLADVIRLLAQQTGGLLTDDDFRPLPCSNPNCCSFTFVARRPKGEPLPLARVVRYEDHVERLADRVNFKLDDAKACCGFGGRPQDFLRVAIKPFMDAYTFDEDRADECCIHVIRPGGRGVSFCRFNTLLRQPAK